MSLHKGRKTPQGRTHRFYTGVAQFSYGEGMSFTSFALRAHPPRREAPGGVTAATSHHVLRRADASGELTIEVALQNTGARQGSTVVMAWFAPAATSGVDHRSTLATRLGQDPPVRSLAAYTRSASLRVGEEAVVSLKVRIDDLAFVDAVTSGRVLPAGEYEVRVDLGPNSASAGEVVHTLRVAEEILM